MSLDLALDRHGDLIITTDNDFALVTGQAVIDQRIRTRLKMVQGEWALDPSSELGSHLNETLRLPLQRAIDEVPLVVKEALAPMDDIHVHDVQCTVSEESPNALEILITYAVVLFASESEDLELAVTIELTGGEGA